MDTPTAAPRTVPSVEPAAPAPHRWWRRPGPWTASLQGPEGDAWRPAWLELLAGGEISMPLERPSPPAVSTPWRPPHRRSTRVPSTEAALTWARTQLHGAPPGWTVALRSADGASVRWRARSVDDVRMAAREMAGWDGPAPTVPPRVSEATEPSDHPRPAAAAGPPGAARGRDGAAPPRPVGPVPHAPSPALTPAQRAVVDHDAGPAVVVAVAGAGKTTTMVARVRHRVATGRSDPARLLVVSFSRAAIAAVRAQLGTDPVLAAVDVRTFHSLAHVLLTAWSRLDGPPPATGPPPDTMVAEVVRHAIRDAAANPDLALAWRTVDLSAFGAYRGRCLARLELPGLEQTAWPASARAEARPPSPDPERPEHRALLEDFEGVRRRLGWVDHDQRLVEAWAALHRSPALLAWARERWRAAIVDEAQDVNAVQLATLERLMAGRDEVVLVGDDDQSVYGFRGAVPGSLRGFAERHRARVLLLPDAFRSRAEPLAAAATLMAHGGGRWPVRPRAARGPGGVLTIDAAAGPDGEAERWSERCRMHRAAGLPWQAQVVLVRRFSQSPLLEVAAARAGVPLRLEGAPPLARHPAVVAAWAGVALVVAPESLDRAGRERAWRRWLAGPGGLTRAAAWACAARIADHPGSGPDAWREAAPRGSDAEIGERLERLADLARSDPAGTLWAAASDPRTWPADPPRAVAAAVSLLRRGPAPAGTTAPTARTPAAREDGARAPSLTPSPPPGAAPPAGPAPAPAAAAQDLATALAAWRADWGRAPPRDAVLVTSVHRAKGLEWPVVHVPGMAAGSFPLSADPEERRLAYVAWTRARDALHLYRDAEAPPSPFLAEGEVTAIAALANDLRWLAARPPDEAALAATWARREACERFGGEPRG